MKLSIIIPTYNEARTIRESISLVQSVEYPIDYEIIIVDDASIDRTYEKETLIKLKTKPGNVRIFKNRINKGKGFSVRKGIKRSKGDLIIVQDADGEYNPREIPKLLAPILSGEADAVFGSRFLNTQHPEGMAFPNWIANKMLTAIANFLYGLRLTDVYTCYKLLKAEIIKDMPLKANRFALDAEVTALLAKRKISIKELPITYHGRSVKEGKKIKARDFVFALLTLLKHRFF